MLRIQVTNPAAHGVRWARLDQLGALGRVVVDATILDPVNKSAVSTEERGDDLDTLVYT